MSTSSMSTAHTLPTAWQTMVCHLAGEPAPEFPPIPGRLHECSDTPPRLQDLPDLEDLHRVAVELGVNFKHARALVRKLEAEMPAEAPNEAAEPLSATAGTDTPTAPPGAPVAR